ncbi:hypothetical protein N0V83_007666 [Neocucurbitaria cava]|uniref:Uncharacterized protein n=1 Tax=Neocucurbitaria cava TaxID=798079 RepID=A0A9W8Y3T4_9PLEO|nr:hypothetical protein N0V83_007666 [Neocucurbitaria cava]
MASTNINTNTTSMEQKIADMEEKIANVEQKVADVVTGTNHTESATKEDIKQLKVDMAQMIQAMLQQLLGAGATKAILQPDPATESIVSIPTQAVLDRSDNVLEASTSTYNHGIHVLPQSVNPNNIDISNATTSGGTAPSLPPTEDMFPILRTAIEVADSDVLVAHVASPQSHLPLPVDNAVEPRRVRDLSRVQKQLSGSTRQHNIKISEMATRSLSCAIEHFVAVSAKTDPQATVEHATQELQSKLGLTATARSIEVLQTITQNWSLKAETVHQKLVAASQISAASDEEKLSSEDLDKLRPIPLVSGPLLCISQNERYDTTIEIYRILKAMNPDPDLHSTCRLADNEAFKLAQHEEICIFGGLHAKLIKGRTLPRAAIVDEYHARKSSRCKQYMYRTGFKKGVKAFHFFVRDALKNARKKVQNRVAQSVHSARNGMHRVAGLLSGPPPPAVTVRSVEIDTDIVDTSGHETQVTSPATEQVVSGECENVPATTLPVAQIDLSQAFTSMALQSSAADDTQPTTVASSTDGQRASGGDEEIPAMASLVAQIDPLQTSTSSALHSSAVDDTQTNRHHTVPATPAPSANQDASQSPSTVPQPQTPGIPTSDQLRDKDLAQLRKTSSPTPDMLLISVPTRSDTIVRFYNTFVEANNTIVKLSKGSEVDLLGELMEAGSAPFWDNFVSLSADNLMDMAKKFEADIVKKLRRKVRKREVRNRGHKEEYVKMAEKIDVSLDADGIEWFAGQAHNWRELELDGLGLEGLGLK